MLQRDYLLEVISQFVEMVSRALKAARMASDPASAVEAAEQAETEVAGLLDMDASVMLALEPASLVTMVSLSGVGEALVGYVAYTLECVGDVYARSGEGALAELRHAQAAAVGEAFGCDPRIPPEEFSASASS